MSIKVRHWMILTVFLVIAGVWTGRLVSLQTMKNTVLEARGNAHSVREVSIPSYRGMIVDRNGEALAISAPIATVWINPQKFQASNSQVSQMLATLNITEKKLTTRLVKYRNREFMYLKRQIMPSIAEQIKELDIPGVHLSTEYKRYYPTGNVSAHVLGFTGKEHTGLEGIELQYDAWLSGRAGSKRILKNRLGQEVKFLANTSKVQQGENLQLSIDKRLQYLAHRALKDAVAKHNAKSGAAVVLDVETGEVLAMVNQPTFNPNEIARKIQDQSYRNRAITDLLEPGSVMKPFSIASALEHGIVTPTTLINTAPGRMRVGNHMVRDLRNHGTVDVATIMRVSSNVGTAKLVLGLPENSLRDLYSRVGFGENSASGFPGERSGVLVHPNSRPFVRATLSFGYGVSVTPLQLARAYAVLGSGGIKRSVSFIKTAEAQYEERVMDETVAREVVSMLAGIVNSRGVSSNARVPGFDIGGKSGTARKIGANGYDKNVHVSIFAGLAPAVNPKFSIVVMIDEPQGKYYGGQVAAPVFSQIASSALRLFNVHMDIMGTQGVRVAKAGNLYP